MAGIKTAGPDCANASLVKPREGEGVEAMEAYAEALLKLDLPMHPVEPFVYKQIDGVSTSYYEIKSKGPFRWRQPMSGEANCAPSADASETVPCS